MDRHRYQRLRDLFHAASELAIADRETYLAGACQDDAGLRAEVEALLHADSHPTGLIFERPVAEAAEMREALLLAVDHEKACPTPTVIGRYRVLRRIGEGGMGVVYEAEQDHPRRTVALKVIRTGITSREILLRFEREAQILGQLQHPAIAQIYDAGTERIERADGAHDLLPFLAMELIRGDSLAHFVRHRDLDLRDKLALMVRVCEAVQYAHQRGIVHRDLKPANIMVLDAEGQRRGSSGPASASAATAVNGIVKPSLVPKILDFGVARLLAPGSATVTITAEVGQLLGTLSYMSPEQVDGDLSLVDTRSDIYSLGVILYELLAGRLPLDVPSHSVIAAARVIQEQEPQPLGSLDARLRGDVSTIVKKALEKDVARRYQSAGDLGADIRRYLSDEPILARAPTARYLLRKFARRHRPMVIGASAALFATLLGLVGVSWFAIEATRAHRAADARAEALRSELYASRIQQIQRIVETDSADPIRALLADCDPKLRGWEWDRLHWLSDRSSAEFKAHDAAATNVQYSPDGTLLLSTGHDGAVKIWDASRLVLLREFQFPRIRCWAQFSEDGRMVAAASNAGKATVLDVSSWSVLWDRSFERLRVESAAVDPPSGRLVLGWWDAGLATEVWNLDGATMAFALEAPAARGGTIRFSRDGSRVLVGSLDGVVSMSDAQGRLVFHERGAKDVGYNAILSPDESHVASIGADGRLTLRDASSGALQMGFDTRKGMSRALAFHPDGKSIAIGSIDGVVTLFDVGDGTKIDSLRGHEAEVTAVTFHPNGQTLASCDADGVVKTWSLDVTRSVYSETSRVTAVCPSTDASSIYFGGYHYGVARLDLIAGTMERSGGPMLHIRHLTASSDGRYLAGWTGDGRWENASGRIAVLGPNMRVLHSWAMNFQWRPEFSAGSQWVLTRDDSGALTIRSVASGEVVHAFADQDEILCAAFVGADQCVVTGHRSGMLSLWSIDTKEKLAALPVYNTPLSQIASTHTGDLVVTWTPGDDLQVWNWRDRQLAATVPNAEGVECLAVSPDGSRLATGSADGTVRLFDLSTGRELLLVGRHRQHVLSVSFSADGRLLASAGRDHTLRLWETGPLMPRKAP